MVHHHSAARLAAAGRPAVFPRLSSPPSPVHSAADPLLAAASGIHSSTQRLQQPRDTLLSSFRTFSHNGAYGQTAGKEG